MTPRPTSHTHQLWLQSKLCYSQIVWEQGSQRQAVRDRRPGHTQTGRWTKAHCGQVVTPWSGAYSLATRFPSLARLGGCWHCWERSQPELRPFPVWGSESAETDAKVSRSSFKPQPQG